MDIFAMKKHCECGWIQPAALAIRTFGSFLKFFERTLGKAVDKLKDGRSRPLAVLNFLPSCPEKRKTLKCQRYIRITMKDEFRVSSESFFQGVLRLMEN